jgi:hypothetical protein
MSRLWALLCAVAAVSFAASPWLAPGFDGFEASQFPVQLQDPPVQPAGYAFAIWGLIFVWLIIGTVFGAALRGDDVDWAPMRKPLFASLAMGTAWLPLAQVAPVLSTVLIWAMLATALSALFRAGDTDRWLQQAPVAIYAGWLTAASCVALGVVIGGYGWLPPTPAALVALLICAGLAVVMQYKLHRAPEYGITVIWALFGVVVANWQPFNAAVTLLALVAMVAILGVRGTDTE